MDVLDSNGNSVFHCEKILEEWKCYYSGLYNPGNDEQSDSKHYATCIIMTELHRNNGKFTSNMNLDSFKQRHYLPRGW